MLDTYIRDFDNNIIGIREFLEKINPIIKKESEEALKELKLFDEGLSLAHRISLTNDAGEKSRKAQELKDKFKGEIIKAEKINKGDLKKKNIKFDRNNKKHYTYTVKASFIYKLESAQTKVKSLKDKEEMLYKNSLINLISSVELFLSQTLHHYYSTFPSSSGISKKSITYEELTKLGSIRDAEKLLIDQKIENIIREGFEHWLDLFKDELKINSNLTMERKNELIEIYQRRNIMVHNGGRVNSIYITKVSPSLIKGISIEDKINITMEYLESSIRKLHYTFIILACNIWAKIDTVSEVRNELLFEITYNNLKSKRWDVACEFSTLLKENKNLKSEHKTISLLNYWLCKTKLGQRDEVENEILKSDFSDKRLRFRIVLSVIKEEFDYFFDNIENALENKEIHISELLDFPIFEDIRQTERFKKFKIESKIFNNHIKTYSISDSIKQ